YRPGRREPLGTRRKIPALAVPDRCRRRPRPLPVSRSGQTFPWGRRPGRDRLAPQPPERVPILAESVRVWPFRSIVMSIVSPGLRSATAAVTSSALATSLPSILVMTSPWANPACSAPEPGVTLATTAPLVVSRPSWRWIPGVRLTVAMPRKGCAGVWPVFSWLMIGMALSMARAKPMFWASPATAVLIPTTSPLALSSGPPELPGLMAASVWRTWRRVSVLPPEPWSPAEIVRSRAETMPSVTVGPPSRARALPMATTESPTTRASELPILTAGRPLASTLRTARSAVASFPRTRPASLRPSASVTVMVLAPAMTWLLVTITPSGLRTNPLPAPCSGTAWRKAPTPRAWVWMDTTDGPTAWTIWWTSPGWARSDARAAATALELTAGAAVVVWFRATIPPATRAPTTAPTTTPARKRRPGPAAPTQGREGRAAGGGGGGGGGAYGGGKPSPVGGAAGGATGGPQLKAGPGSPGPRGSLGSAGRPGDPAGGGASFPGVCGGSVVSDHMVGGVSAIGVVPPV